MNGGTCVGGDNADSLGHKRNGLFLVRVKQALRSELLFKLFKG